MAKKRKLSNTEYHLNMDMEMEIANQSKTQKERQEADAYYNDNISRAAVGRLFNDDVVMEGDEPAYVAGYDDSEYDEDDDEAAGEYAAYEDGRDEAAGIAMSDYEEEDNNDFDEVTERNPSYMSDEEYMDYIDSMSRSTKNERPRALVQPETVRQAVIKDEVVQKRKAAAVSRYQERAKAVTNSQNYDDEDYDEAAYASGEASGLSRYAKLIAAFGGAILLLVLAFFVIQLNTANARLAETSKELADASKAQSENQRLTIENEGLTEQLDALKAENESLRQQAAGIPSGDGGTDIISSEGGGTADPGNTQPSTVSPPPAAQGTAAASPTPGSKYVVKKGETFWKIAEDAYSDGTRYKEIMQANGITNENGLAAGQEIMIP